MTMITTMIMTTITDTTTTDTDFDSIFRPRETYALTRFVFLRGLGLVYFVSFLALSQQILGLVGSRGLLPTAPFFNAISNYFESPAEAWFRVPTLFWFNHSDAALLWLSRLGALLALVVVAGFANAPILAGLWLIQLSALGALQVFYGYGWEMLLLEVGFLAIFLAAPWKARPWAASAVPFVVMILLRWVLFRLMFGAGLIKVRGDPCWLELTCLDAHYETQPLPNPLSWLLNQAPHAFHATGVLFNHFVELIVPWGLFGPKRVRTAAGLITALFQTFLILSGNLSYFNFLTLVLCVACLDDDFWKRVLPKRLHRRIPQVTESLPKPRKIMLGALCVLIGALSTNPIINMLSPRQLMNASFDPFHLVNTYGAFGSVGKERFEVILEGTRDERPTPTTRWLEYELPCKPGDLMRRPCVVAPYQYRLDWQLWFAAFRGYEGEPWILNLAHKLTLGEPSVLALFAKNPFPDAPPRFVRARLYRYQFTRFGEPGWWKRELIGEYLRPMRRDDPQLLELLDRRGW
jgi:hypothetical protein